jgi:hypothetical protein
MTVMVLPPSDVAAEASIVRVEVKVGMPVWGEKLKVMSPGRPEAVRETEAAVPLTRFTLTE